MSEIYFGIAWSKSKLSPVDREKVESVLPESVVSMEHLAGNGKWCRWFQTEDRGTEDANDAVVDRVREAVEKTGVNWMGN